MIAILALALQTTPPATTPEIDKEIVVVGERLKSWTGKVNQTFGIRTCRTIKSTGDGEIDKIGCRALTDCFVVFKPKIFAAYKEAGRDKARRSAAMVPINEQVGVCVKQHRDALIAELVARRKGAQG